MPEETYPPIVYDPDDWTPVYQSQEELDSAMRSFSDAVSEDVQIFNKARKKSWRLIFQEHLGIKEVQNE